MRRLNMGRLKTTMKNRGQLPFLDVSPILLDKQAVLGRFRIPCALFTCVSYFVG